MDRLQFLEYNIGIRDDFPIFVKNRMVEWRNPTAKENLIRDMEATRKRFAQADIFTRTYAVQGLLDESTGLLSDSESINHLNDVILGKYKNDGVFKKIFLTYLDSVPPGEKKVIIGYILSSFADPVAAKSGASLKAILEAMGPFGIKVGQYLRSSGLVSKDLQKELDHFFDFALPPSRPMIHDDVARVFGEELVHIKSTNQMLGSGSINYTVHADIKASPHEEAQGAVIRFKRQNVGGLVRNESKNWETTIAKLTKDPNPEIQKFARLLDEARLVAMDNLKEGGRELDLSYERGQYAAAKDAYEAAGNRKFGMKVEVGRPLEDLQKLVPQGLQKDVSVYEYVPNVNIRALTPEKQREVAMQIMDTELHAMFELGTFDPDGHAGNWLIDIDHNRLVRIDYAQIRTSLPEEQKAFKTVFGTLINPTIGNGQIQTIAREFDHVFEYRKGKIDLQDFLKRAVKKSDFPTFSEPHQRMLFLRKELQDYLATKGVANAQVRLTENARASLASMGKLMFYKEFMTEQDFARIMMDNVPVPKTIRTAFRVRDFLYRVKEDGLIKTMQGALHTRGVASSTVAEGRRSSVQCLRMYLKILIRGAKK